MSDRPDEERGGIDARTWARLAKLLRGEEEVYSYVRRPGSWEWHTDTGARMRDELAARGYIETADPAAIWRVSWVKGGDA